MSGYCISRTMQWSWKVSILNSTECVLERYSFKRVASGPALYFQGKLGLITYEIRAAVGSAWPERRLCGHSSDWEGLGSGGWMGRCWCNGGRGQNDLVTGIQALYPELEEDGEADWHHLHTLAEQEAWLRRSPPNGDVQSGIFKKIEHYMFPFLGENFQSTNMPYPEFPTGNSKWHCRGIGCPTVKISPPFSHFLSWLY